MNVQKTSAEGLRASSVNIFRKSTGTTRFSTKTNIKINYSCTDNLQTIFKKHNRKILETSKTPSTLENCNCGKKNTVRWKTTASPQASSTMPTNNRKWHNRKEFHWTNRRNFKQRYTRNKLSLRNRNYSNSTELSKHIRTLKDNNTSILATARPTATKASGATYAWQKNLIRAKKPSLLNKRSELICKCRHENKFYLAYFTSRQQ